MILKYIMFMYEAAQSFSWSRNTKGREEGVQERKRIQARVETPW
jgi:hypothetical protein